MIVWFFIALFFLWSFSPTACILFVLSGVLLAIAKIKTTEKKDNNTINFENEERKSRFNSRRNDGKYYKKFKIMSF